MLHDETKFEYLGEPALYLFIITRGISNNHILDDNSNSWSLRLSGTICETQVHVLFDRGSSHNVIDVIVLDARQVANHLVRGMLEKENTEPEGVRKTEMVLDIQTGREEIGSIELDHRTPEQNTPNHTTASARPSPSLAQPSQIQSRSQQAPQLLARATSFDRARPSHTRAEYTKPHNSRRSA